MPHKSLNMIGLSKCSVYPQGPSVPAGKRVQKPPYILFVSLHFVAGGIGTAAGILFQEGNDPLLGLPWIIDEAFSVSQEEARA